MFNEHKKYNLIGEIKSKNIENLRISIFLNRFQPEEIKGEIYCTYNECKQLEPLLGKVFEIIGHTDGDEKIRIKDCNFNQLKYKRGANENVTYKQVKFTAQEIETCYSHNPEALKKENVKIHIRFFIEGGCSLFPPYSQQPSYNGNVECEIKPYKFEINSSPIEFTYIFQYKDNDYETSSKLSLVHTRPTITIEPKENSYNKLSETLDNARQLIHDITVFMSLCSSQRISYSEYELLVISKQSDAIESRSCFRRIRSKKHQGHSAFPLIPDYKFKDFFSECFTRYLELKDKFGFETIIYGLLMASEEYSYAEQSFLTLCTCLETLKNAYSEHKDIRFIIDESQFKKLKDRLSAELKSFIDNAYDEDKNELKSQFIQRVNNLNQSSFKKILQALFCEYGIQTNDLISLTKHSKEKDIFYFPKLRNKLIHTGQVENDLELLGQSLTIRYLIEKLILSILGWNKETRLDKSVPPNPKTLN